MLIQTVTASYTVSQSSLVTLLKELAKGEANKLSAEENTSSTSETECFTADSGG